MNATKQVYDVFRSENRAGGRCDWVGTVEATSEEAALAYARGEFECRETSHLWVAIESDQLISDLGVVYAWQDDSGWHYTETRAKAPETAQQARQFAELDDDGNHLREWIALGFAGDGLEIELVEFEYVR